MGRYLLMNKDSVVMGFDLPYGSSMALGLLPYGLKDIYTWLDERVGYCCVRDVGKLWKSTGVSSIEDIINITHCVSLNDTFWVKKADSPLLWEGVSPFRNSFSRVISTYSLEGLVVEGDDGYFSPDICTGGSFPPYMEKSE